MEAAALAASASSSILGGMSARSAAQAEKRQAEANAYIGRTRAIQTDTAARESLSSELGNMRAVLGANQQGTNVGTFEMFQELRSVRDRERRVEVGNRMQEVYDFQTAGRNAQAQGNAAMLSGLAGSAQSLFSLYQL